MNSEDTQETPNLHVVDIWSGRHATALRTALRLTVEQFAHQLGTSVRTVAKWTQDADIIPGTELQRVLDTALRQAGPEDTARFVQLYEKSKIEQTEAIEPRDSKRSLSTFPQESPLVECFVWIDKASHNAIGTAQSQIEQIMEESAGSYRKHPTQLPKVNELIGELEQYYDDLPQGYEPFEITIDATKLKTGLLVQRTWTDLAMPLGEGKDRLEFSNKSQRTNLNPTQSRAAAERIVRAIREGTRIANAPLYNLVELSVTPESIQGTVEVTDFLSYALTLDLLEHELISELQRTRPGALKLPLRDSYLPTFNSITSLGERLCAGGVATVFAAKRPKYKRHMEQDYAILIQERSSAVINAVGRLAVIPKGCHQPLTDYTDDAQVSATVERELEEELFSRRDLDGVSGVNRLADPLHLSRLSEPFRWLISNDSPDTWRMECTGIGLNMVNGNFEIACLITVQDETWWETYGGSIESNWESSNLRCYSSKDAKSLTRLLVDGNLGNEDLFALALGLSRLQAIEPTTVQLPSFKYQPSPRSNVS